MPSSMHEVLVKLCTSAPDFMLKLTGQQIAHTSTEFANADVNESIPATAAADAVLLLRTQGIPTWAYILEVQLKPDPTKEWTLPLYLASVGREHRCPVSVLMICPDRATTNWARNLPNKTHPQAGITWKVTVIGPDDVPANLTPNDPQLTPPLAVLAMIIHGHTNPTPLIPALNTALTSMDPHRAAEHADFVVAALPREAAQTVKDIMSTTIPSWTKPWIESLADQRAQELAEERAAELAEERVAEAQARVLLKILDSRGISMTPELTDRVLSCTNLDELRTWIDRALRADQLNDVFATAN